MRREERDLFETIFEDAIVVDVDLSKWDKLVSLWVIADHAPLRADGRLPLFVVEFVRVRELGICFRHWLVRTL